MENKNAVYILSNYTNTTFYIGVTNNLYRRIKEHKDKINKGFTNKYHLDKLVYFEMSESIEVAIQREKQLKNWKRVWKEDLIKSINPSFQDLSEDIGL